MSKLSKKLLKNEYSEKLGRKIGKIRGNLKHYDLFASKASTYSKLFDSLSKKDKKGILDSSGAVIPAYSTGIAPLTYANGYIVEPMTKYNPDAKPWVNAGIQAGGFCTTIGGTNSGKTALTTKMAANMVYPYEFGEVYHNDAEETSNIMRIKALTGWTQEELDEKYHVFQCVYVEDLFTMLMNMAQEKIEDKSYLYDTGLLNIRGEHIIIPQPTAVIIDALPSMQTKDVEDSVELGSQTYNMRLAIAYNTFYKRLRPVLTKANITVFAVNHIKEKPQIGFTMTPAKVQYMKPNESIPGGTGPLYYSQILMRLIYRGKLTEEKNGFEGFMSSVEILKSKANRSGRLVDLVFTYDHGFDEQLTLLHMAKTLKLIGGRNPNSFFVSTPDLKFNTKDFIEENMPAPVREALIKELTPHFNKMIKNNRIEQRDTITKEEVADILNASYDVKDADITKELDDVL